jgi:putative DNA primase/helicase
LEKKESGSAREEGNTGDAGGQCHDICPTGSEPEDGLVAARILKTLADSELTDDGNAQRLVTFLQGRMRYVPERKQWFRWDQRSWIPDSDGSIYRELRRMRHLLGIVAARIDNEKRRKALEKQVARLGSKAKISAAVELAASIEGVPLHHEDFDTDPWVFNTPNGTVDLRTGVVRPQRPNDFITKLAGTTYLPNVTCPRWLQFLRELCCGDDDLVEYLQRAVGYSLTGSTTEHVLHIMVGGGANGKSTFLETIRKVFGTYARQADFSTFLETKGDRVRNDLACLVGARLVIAVEGDPEKALAESTVKQLTGGDAISARFLFKEFFEYRPQLKLWLAANHRPSIKRCDKAMWRRIRLLPCDADFSREDVRDKSLSQKLEAELPGILAWALAGAVAWQRDGLTPPKTVTDATSDYREEQDTVGGFIEDRCVLEASARERPKPLYLSYQNWCEEGNIEPLKASAFRAYLEGRKLVRKKSNGERRWRGIRLRKDVFPQ